MTGDDVMTEVILTTNLIAVYLPSFGKYGGLRLDKCFAFLL